MTIKKNFSLALLDYERLTEVYKIIVNYASITYKSSSYLYYDIQPLNLDETAQDMIFFQLRSEDERGLDKKLNDLIETLNQTNIDYGLKDEASGEIIVSVNSVGQLNIKFDNIKIIKEGTFKKIDELKLLKTEFGRCKGFKPDFRPLESQSIENLIVNPESIQLFSDSPENMSKLKELITEKILEIDPDFEIEFELFT